MNSVVYNPEQHTYIFVEPMKAPHLPTPTTLDCTSLTQILHVALLRIYQPTHCYVQTCMSTDSTQGQGHKSSNH